MWVGWIGFNGGSTTTGDPGFAHIVSNTMLSAAFGGMVGTIIGRFHDGLFRPDRSINGVLGGLVGITAGCDVLTTFGAIMIGLTSGIVVYYSALIMERKFGLDDAVGAVPVHGFCGAWGTICLAFLMPEVNLAAETRFEQFSIQLQGVLIAFCGHLFGIHSFQSLGCHNWSACISGAGDRRSEHSGAWYNSWHGFVARTAEGNSVW